MQRQVKEHGTLSSKTKHIKSTNSNTAMVGWLFMIGFIFWIILLITYYQLPGNSNSRTTLSLIGKEGNVNSEILSRKYYQEQLNMHRIQSNNNNKWSTNRLSVRNTFISAWNAYSTHCFGQDELFPYNSRCRNWIGLGLTIIDSMDTMYFMDLSSQFNIANKFIINQLNFNKNVSVSFFETIIRCVGTMITLYDLTENDIYLNHLRILMDNLLPAFNTKYGFPGSDINLFNGDIRISSCDGKCVVFADIASIQLEFNAACDRLNDYKYCIKSDNVINQLDPHHPKYIIKNEIILPGHYPILLNLDGSYASNIIRWGAMGDSFYEYLLKLWIYEEHSRKKRSQYYYDKNRSNQYARMYITAVDAMLNTLYKYNEKSGLYYIAEIVGDQLNAKMDELACFVGGNLALASYRNITQNYEKSTKYLNAAIELTETCYQMYHQTRSGLAGEYVVFNKNGMFNNGAADYYLLRPETVESLFYLYRITRNDKYREYGWNIYQSIETNCKLKEKDGSGYAPISKVNSKPRIFKGGLDHVMVMHSFFLSETLKYLYLLFSDDELIPLDRYVFNTEGHPILL